jgi:FlaA1/EpsC-like NDP-sugar epimerase
VPLMEENVVEAITNNVMGTSNVVDAAIEAGTPHFVLISTDKVVRPTSMMGASKRAAELVVQHAGAQHGRHFVSVRFGNVLGSRGSVVPTFLRQIRAGGPVTVTHPEMRRFFMTIPEAVQLVLQAAVLGRGGEVFVLDMGEPVRVVDLAADLIRLSGLEIGRDIEIRFTGMRPGEKLYEEMFFDEESAVPTIHPKVLRAKNAAPEPGAAARLEALVAAAASGAEDDALRSMLISLVPDFVGTPAAQSDVSSRASTTPAERARIVA